MKGGKGGSLGEKAQTESLQTKKLRILHVHLKILLRWKMKKEVACGSTHRLRGLGGREVRVGRKHVLRAGGEMMKLLSSWGSPGVSRWPEGGA